MEQEKKTENIRRSLSDFLVAVADFFRDLIDLRQGLDREGTIVNIKNNKRMRGANAWLLMCSIMVASLGLDLNSPAVIIGAMLISPLMSPILGIGLSVGINDREMLTISIQHFLVSIAIALITSYLYFELTPLGNLTPEIEARTAPTFLDVLVAFFGGVAGIISGSRKDQSNAIPGVAIATALMPPLCVTGYGLANGEPEIILNSFYLFFLNATFVALATYMIVRFLNFPSQEFGTRKEKIRTQAMIIVFSAILIAPSIYILSGVLRKLNERTRIENYFETNFSESLWKLDENKRTDSLEAKLFLFDNVDGDSIQIFQDQFNALNCRASLDVVQTNISQSEINLKTMQENIREELLSKLEADQQITDEREKRIEALTNALDSLRSDTVIFAGINRDARIFFTDLEELRYARMQAANKDTSVVQIPTMLVKWSPYKTRSARRRDQAKLEEFVLARGGLDTVVLIPY